MRDENTNPVVRFFRRPYRYAAVFSLLLTAAFVFILLDAFVIPKALQSVPRDSAQERPTPMSGGAGQAQSLPIATANTYQDTNIEITIDTIRVFDTDVYIADVRLRDYAYLKTAFAGNLFGRNINSTTSAIAAEQNAIFAVNGDYYGFRDNGWVLRNGALYRSGGSATALLMDTDGNLFCESDGTSIERQIESLWQIWSFGPPLVLEGVPSVNEDQEVSGRSSNSNPRTAIGQAGPLHYVFIVSDGRTAASAGLSLYQLATLFVDRGCFISYNLDGGGSSTMVFNGQVINRPTTGGKRVGEREVSDIVYVGY